MVFRCNGDVPPGDIERKYRPAASPSDAMPGVPQAASRADRRAERSQREGTLWRYRTIFPDFTAGNAVPQIDGLPARKTGGGGSCSSGTGCICPDGLGLDELLLCGSLPDPAHRHRQLVAWWIEGPWVGVDQAAARTTLRNS